MESGKIKKTICPFGLWNSPITAASLAEARRLGDVCWDTDGKTLVWLEGRSAQNVLVAQHGDTNAPVDLTSDLNVRAEVGYGGGDFTVYGGYVYFTAQGGRIYRQSIAGGKAVAITPASGKACSPAFSPDGRWVAYIHADDEGNDRLAVVDTEGRFWPQILATGHDFYMQPKWSGDGRYVTFIAWDHPLMPWDGTTLYLAELKYGDGVLPRLERVQRVAGGADAAIFQPEFSHDSRNLFYISDETGWGHLWSYDLSSSKKSQLTHGDAEYGTPPWGYGMRRYAASSDGRSLVVTKSELGFSQLCRLDLETRKVFILDEVSEYSAVSQPIASPIGNQVAFIGSSSLIPLRVVVYDLEKKHVRVVARAISETLQPGNLSQPKAITWSTAGGEVAHGLFYAPTNESFESKGTPPLVMLVHGGPTSQAVASWNPSVQFFTSRGYAVLNLNYRGSTGYGRKFMLRLRGQWGVCDVEDAVSGKKYLAQNGYIDPRRTVIMGGSAGGYTVLETMVDAPEEFTAGINMFGISNQFTAATDTHKFESRYNDSLIGELPECSQVYRDRSPIFHAEKIKRPLAVFQGDQDQVVYRDQSDAIVDAMKRTGTPHVYHLYEGEGHGWRKRETVLHFYQAVEKFLKQYVLYS